MEFMLKYEAGGATEIAAVDDPHLRTYIVGQYSIAGEREDGFADWKNWDRWLPYETEYAPELPAAAIFFAQELRKTDVPVGILACNWGGTTASTWLDISRLERDGALKVYLADFEEKLRVLDLERYEQINRSVRKNTNAKDLAGSMDFIMSQTIHPDRLMELLAQSMGGGGDASGEDPFADMMTVGPNDKNVPGRLYETMLKEIMGYSARGVIWYQGESDERHADLYDRLFSEMIACWREDWQDELPFLFVQLAPYGIWLGNIYGRYPAVRAAQERVSKTVPGAYMACISDLGNVYDIHPKEKKAVGLRLALLAQKYVYQQNVPVDAPEAAAITKENDTLTVSFAHREGLYQTAIDLERYNGFSLEEIKEELRPPVLGGVCGLEVTVDGKKLTEAECSVEADQLVITADEIKAAEQICVAFSNTGFYQVHIFNGAGLPVKPFVLGWKKEIE